MALSNIERQRRWLEKNRAAFNLRRRQARKGGTEEEEVVSAPQGKRSTIEDLRALIKAEETRTLEEVTPAVEVEVRKPTVYRNDYGATISERAWERLQEKKRIAESKGYELDEWSQL